MDIRVVDKNGVTRNWEWVRNKYGNVEIEVLEGDGYRVCQLTEIEGPMVFTCTVLNEGGGPVVGQQVAYMWPDGEAIEITNGSGVAEHTAGGGEGYDPHTAQGPISWEVRGVPSERIRGLGWLWGTNHTHLQVTMQWSGGGGGNGNGGDLGEVVARLEAIEALLRHGFMVTPVDMD